MKGKERSPVKKRLRAPDDGGRDRVGGGGGGGSGSGGQPGGKKSLLGGNNSNGSVHGPAPSRRSLPSDKRDSRERDGYNNPPGRTGGGYDYRAVCGNKSHVGADIAADAARSSASSRGEPRPPPPPGPESEYKSLKISELGCQLSDGAVEDGLFHEFNKFGDVSVKISRENDERVAFVNFRRPEDARAAKHARGKLVLYDRPLKIETVYTNRRRSRSPGSKDGFPPGGQRRGPSPPATGYRDFRLQQLAMGRALPPPPPPPPAHLIDLDRDREFSVYEARARPPFIPECAVFRDEEPLGVEDDQRANRTLFLGNLDVMITESELRRAFERFGLITEVDIKRATRGQTNTYGFVKFENLDVAHRAKVAMSGKVVGHNPVKIGYGKPTPTTRLWVGGLGPWVPLASLAKEFDRFGAIRTIDYRKGQAWAYIQYESLDAAQAACSHMRGFPLGGSERRLRVDFADTEHRYQQQQQQQQQFMQLPLPLPHYDLVPEPFAHHLPDSGRSRERSPPLPARYRDRDPYASAEWPGLAVHERMRGGGGGFDPMDHLDRRPREAWTLEHERDLGRKRRHVDEGWWPEHVRNNNNGDYSLRRHGASLPEQNPVGGGGREGGRYGNPDRPPRSGRSSPVRERQNTQDAGDQRRRTLSPNEPGAERDRKPGNPFRSEHSSSKSKSASGGQKLARVWQGVLLLKNSSFPTSLHLLEGDVSLASGLLAGGAASRLKISQRLRLDRPKLDEVSRRIKSSGAGGYSVLLAVPGTDAGGGPDGGGGSAERPLKNLVSYLTQKEAAGIVSLPVGGGDKEPRAGVLHVFPPCDFSRQFVDSAAAAFAKAEDEYMVMVIIKGAA